MHSADNEQKGINLHNSENKFGLYIDFFDGESYNIL